MNRPAYRADPRLLVLATFVLLAGLARGARADGWMTVAPEYQIYEDEQIALLDWDAGAGQETLTIMPGYRTNATEFAWVVPVPSLPEVTVDSRHLFYELESITGPVYRDRDGSFDCGTTYDEHLTGAPSVQIVSREVVGDYEVTILQADFVGALTDTLIAWGYLDATQAGAAYPVLEDYIARDWTFVTARVAYPYVETYPEYYRYGALQPLVLSFATPEPVFPLRISQLSAAEETWLEIYVCSAHRYTFPGADAVYANRVSAEEHRQITRRAPRVAARVAPGRFLTRLQRPLAPADMVADIVLQRAEDDREFRLLRYGGWPVTWVLFGGPVAGWLVWRRRRGAG